jgi:hypothetical protein
VEKSLSKAERWSHIEAARLSQALTWNSLHEILSEPPFGTLSDKVKERSSREKELELFVASCLNGSEGIQHDVQRATLKARELADAE